MERKRDKDKDKEIWKKKMTFKIKNFIADRYN